MVENLRAAGWELEPPPQQRDTDAPVGRPHIARAAFEHPANASRLRDEGLGTPSDLLVAYLLPGTPGYSPRLTPTVPEALAAIHAAGGLAVWAHPFWDVDDPEQVTATIARFAALGFDGVEVFYTAHTPEQTRIAYDAARAHGLLTTGSADFHGPGHEHFDRFRAFDLCGLEPHLGPLAP